jgi:tRNA dimethylallyltransferase
MEIANSFDGEIVSADSRQIYRHMNIGTAKASPSDRAAVPHHLVDVANPDDSYSLALFLEQSSDAIKAIHKRAKLPVLAGGSGQYVWGLLEGWQVPKVPPDSSIRERLEERARVEGPEALYRELVSLDEHAAQRIDPRNPRRIIRALEVAHSSTPASDAPRKTPPDYETLIIGLTIERKALYRRIDERVDIMIASGWVDEVRRILDMGYGPELPSMSSFGYGELVQHLRGEISIDEAIQRIKFKTHRFARQQYNWFRLNDERIKWFDASHGHDAVIDFVRDWLAFHS